MHVNYEWVKEQFAESKTRVAVGKAVLDLLKVWETIDLNPEQARRALEIFQDLGMGHSLVSLAKDEVWVDAKRGQLSVGDQVRVMHDAFDGELGAIHNGRRGTIVAIRSGDIIVNSIDGKRPSIDGVHYQPEKLQKRIR
jgi:PHP family Zn ribbon phosphoesterase